ncbi:MAG: DUF4124 domain-containing protein [Burkholderiales bacterium]|jgi:hypothetical protein|nr:DUF4124 domain-containing protein [Burkholderiales bacterium]
MMELIAKRMTGVFFLVLLLLAGTAVAAPPSGGKTYKWVDDKGVIHYSDKAPLEAVNREQTILDNQARTVRRIDAAPPESQRRLSEEGAEKQRLEQVQKDIAARKDRALLLSYFKEEDLDFARDRTLSLLAAQVEATNAVLSQLQTRHKNLLERRETGGVLPEGELEKLESDIVARSAAIDRDLREKESIYARYERDKQRWRELKEAEKARLEAEQQANKK